MPTVKMELSARAYKEFKMMMKRMRYDDEDMFVKYCVLKTIKPYADKDDQPLIAEEIKAIQSMRVD